MKELLEFNDKLKGYALSLTRDIDKANDLLQETNLKMLLVKDKYPPCDIHPISLRMMKNLFIDDCRFNSRFTNNMPEQEYSIHPADNLNYTYLVDTINSLDAKFKVSFTMYVDGYKYHEISEIERIPINTVRSRIRKARIILRSKLEYT